MVDVHDAPILEFDPDPTAVVEPDQVVEARPDHAERAVLCFFSQVIDRLKREDAPVLFELEAAHGIHPVYGFDLDGERIAVFHPGVGAALAGGFFEESMAHGCRTFMAVGTAGGLAPSLTLGTRSCRPSRSATRARATTTSPQAGRSSRRPKPWMP